LFTSYHQIYKTLTNFDYFRVFLDILDIKPFFKYKIIDHKIVMYNIH